MVVGGGIAGMQASPGRGCGRLQSLSGGEGDLHRRGHGPTGQDLPHQRLFHLPHLSQAHRGGPASGHRDPDPGRDRQAGGRGGPFHRDSRTRSPAISTPPNATPAAPAPRPARCRCPPSFDEGLGAAPRPPTAIFPRPCPPPSPSRNSTGPPASGPARPTSAPRATCSSSRPANIKNPCSSSWTGCRCPAPSAASAPTPAKATAAARKWTSPWPSAP